MSDQAQEDAAPASSSWSDDILHGAEIGAGVGTFLPMLGGPIGGAVLGGVAGAADHLWKGMFDDAPAPASSPAPVPDAAPTPAAPAQPDLNSMVAKNGGDFQKAAGQYIDQGYKSDDDLDKLPPATDANGHSDSIGKLGTPEERLAALNNINQNDPSDPKSEHHCGPAALMAAAMYANGSDGVKGLMNDMEAGHKKGDPNDFQMENLRKKIDGGGDMTQADMKMMQDTLYQNMLSKQKDDTSLSDDTRKNEGINSTTMQNFINSDPALAKSFKDKGMKMELVNADGKGTLNHYALDINDPNKPAGPNGNANTVYDPFARNKGQVIDNSDPDALRAYNGTRHQEVPVGDGS